MLFLSVSQPPVRFLNIILGFLLILIRYFCTIRDVRDYSGITWKQLGPDLLTCHSKSPEIVSLLSKRFAGSWNQTKYNTGEVPSHFMIWSYTDMWCKLYEMNQMIFSVQFFYILHSFLLNKNIRESCFGSTIHWMYWVVVYRKLDLDSVIQDSISIMAWSRYMFMTNQ